MKEYIKNLARKGADAAGHLYLTGPVGAGRLRKLLPRPTLYSMDNSWRSALVLAPHPDDEIFGAGLLLDRLREQKTEVTIAFVTSGGAYSAEVGGNRRKEAEASAAHLGARAVFFDFKDGQLQNSPGLNQQISKLVAEIEPQAIVLPWFGDYHPDHRAVARAAMLKPQINAQYLFYSTFSPLWPAYEFKMSFVVGGEEKVKRALEGYSSSVNRETISGFLTLRRALARTYLDNITFWEPMLTIAGSELARNRDLAVPWPRIYPTLKKRRHWRKFIHQVRKFHQTIGKTK